MITSVNYCRIVEFGNYKYPLYIMENLTMDIYDLLEPLNVDRFFILYDENLSSSSVDEISNLLKERWGCHTLSIQAKENNKNLLIVNKLLEECVSLGATRKSCIIAFGGGLVGNLAGMVAALLYRGVHLIHLPTTFMAMSDSVLSLKQAVNSDYGKNHFGMFYPCTMVVENLKYLDGLTISELRGGFTEFVKNMLAIKPEYIEEWIVKLNPRCVYSPEQLKQMIDLSISAKMHVMKDDPHERMRGLALEYGHTFGHAIELLSKGQILHGEAVGIGMICAAHVSYELGFITKEELNLHYQLLNAIGCQTNIPSYINPEMILEAMNFDNKRGYLDNCNDCYDLVLLERLGKILSESETFLVPVKKSVVREVIYKLMEEKYLWGKQLLQ